MIRLRDIAKHLPTSIREAVADAALYDPPSPHTAPDSHLEHTAPQKTVSGDMQHLPTRAAAPAVYHDTVAIPPYEQSLAESSPAKTTVSSAQKSAGAALQALASAAHKDGVAAHAHRQSEESHLNTTHAASRQLPAAAQHAKHGTAAESAAPAWRNPAELSSREVALEKLLAAKLSQPVQQQREIVSEASVKSVGRSTVRFRHSTSVFGRKPTSAPIVKHAPSAVPAPSLSGIAPHAVEVAPRREGYFILHFLAIDWPNC